MAKTVEIFRAPDSKAELQRAQQQQMLAQAMMASGQSPDDMFSQWNRMPIVPQYGLGHGLTQLGSSLAGAYINKQANQKIEKVEQNEKAASEKARREAMAKLMQKTVTESKPAGPYADGYQYGESTQEKPKDHGQVLADAMMAAEAGVPKEVIEAYIKSNEAYTLGDTRFLANQPVASNEKPLDELSKLEADFKGRRVDLKGYLARKELLTTRSAGVNVNVNTEKNLYGTMADAQGKANVELYTRAQKAPELLARAQRVKQMLGPNSEAITGAGAEWMLAAAKVANQVGINTGDAAADTETLSRDLAAATLDGIKASGLGAGSGFSNADRDFLEKVVGGKITLEATTLKRLADLNEKSAIGTIQSWNAQADRLDPNQLKSLGMSKIEVPAGMETSGKPKLSKNPDGSFNYTP
jgi:hypothetical protein